MAVLRLCCCDGFFLFVTSRATLELWCADFSVRWLLLLQSMGSRMCGSVVLAPGLQSSGSVVVVHGFLALRMWDLLGPGMDPVSPALTGGFFSTEPPGQPPFVYFCLYFYCLRRLA